MALITIHSVEDADLLMETIRGSAARVVKWISSQTGDPLEMLRRMKFEPVGYHPIEGQQLNLVEQINQTWTFAVAIAATRQLLVLHPEAGGFHLAPGAHASLPLDIMSVAEGLVGAETFAAVTPRNNGKLEADLVKLGKRPETHRYVFFMSPLFPGNERRPQLERNGVQVWSVDVPGSTDMPPWLRQCQHVIRTVKELHRLGYQRLRICPYDYPLAWRLCIAPAHRFSSRNGAFVKHSDEFPVYSSATENCFSAGRTPPTTMCTL